MGDRCKKGERDINKMEGGRKGERERDRERESLQQKEWSRTKHTNIRNHIIALTLL